MRQRLGSVADMSAIAEVEELLKRPVQTKLRLGLCSARP